MLKTIRLDLGEQIKSEIGNRVIVLLLFLFAIMAIYLSDIKPAINSIYAIPIATLSLMSLIGLTLVLIPKGYSVYRWVSFTGLLILPPMLIYFFQQPGILFLMTLAVLIAPILFNIGIGVFLALTNSIFVYVVARQPLLSTDQVFFAILSFWMTLAVTLFTHRFFFETVGELNRKYNENQLLLTDAREQQGQLNELIKERTEANIKLVRLNQYANHLRQIAEDERKIKEEFVTRVSHELRSPLNMIVGFCTVLTQTNQDKLKHLPKAIVEDLEIILRNSQHLSRLINDILDLSQINAGQMAMIKEETSLPDLITEVVSSVLPLFEKKNLYLRTDIPNQLPAIFCDKTRIAEVLLNLLSNAGRYTQEGGVTIQAISRERSVEIRVIDTGIGIPKQKQDRLFHPFYQADGSIRRRFGGTGLGLSISKNIVELHSGRMWVESEEGKGTTFIFRLPVEETVNDLGSARRWFNPHQPEFLSPAQPSGPDKRIMPRIVTVDPDGGLTHLLQRYMSNGEYISRMDLAEGIEEVNQTLAQILLVNTEQISSDLERLRSAETLPFGIPAILCSIPTALRNKSQLEIFDILVKPIDQKDLAASVARLGPNKKTVLIVDDEPDSRNLLKRMLTYENPDIVVLNASNGIHAIRAMKRHQVDVILLDLVMPKMDGYQFLAAKKEMQEYKDIPVILISAHQVQERPVVSDGLGIVIRGGLTIQKFIQCLSALSAALGS